MTDAAADSLIRLYDAFGGRLYAAAESLIDRNCVRDVRILQAGDVIVGIADCDVSRGTSHRVYIRNRSRAPDRRPVSRASQDNGIEGECSCGERDPCVHVAAVLIAAARGASIPAPGSHRAQIEPPPSPTRSLAPHAAGQRQQLCYLLELAHTQPPSDTTAGQLRLSLWVGQTVAGSTHLERDSAHPFALRGLISGDRAGNGWGSLLPRYIDAHDKEFLAALTTQHIDGPWDLHGAGGADLMTQAVATGRAFWQSLHAKPLRAGASRRVAFAWETMPSGDQRLRLATPASMSLMLGIEPAVYIDATTGECGRLELPCTQALLQQFWMCADIAPEQAESANENIARDASAASFPGLRAVHAEKQPLSSLKARLVLSAGPEATRTRQGRGRGVGAGAGSVASGAGTRLICGAAGDAGASTEGG